LYPPPKIIQGYSCIGDDNHELHMGASSEGDESMDDNVLEDDI